MTQVLGKSASDDTAYLQSCRAKRNAAEYDGANEATDTEARELTEFARALERRVLQWLRGRPTSPWIE